MSGSRLVADHPPTDAWRGPHGEPRVAVVICAFADERWHDLHRAIASVQDQTLRPAEIVVVIDHNPRLLQRVRTTLPGVTAIANTGDRGAGEARNAGVAHTSSPIIAFLDDDAIAAPDWLENLVRHHDDPFVVGTGGAAVPAWDTGVAPKWFPDEFGWVVGASYSGMPSAPETVRNVWTCSMSVRREVFDSVGGFRSDFGKVGARSRPEDTEFCIRAARSRPRGRWIYEPAARILHRVPRERATVRYFLRRCYAEGAGKAEMASLFGADDVVTSERDYVVRTCRSAVARGLRGVVRGDRQAALRALAIIGGLATAGMGYGAALSMARTRFCR